MKAKDLFDSTTGELKHKVRTIKDLIRFIETKENKDVSNYSIFLGAGASRSSGIATAHELILEWMAELYERYKHQDEDLYDENSSDYDKYSKLKNYFEIKHASWFDGNNPYSSLFEKKFDLPPQRRRFVEQEVDKKLPSIGYSYLVSLVENNYFNAIFTTNFDDLLNEAFYQLSSTRPIVCAHDSSVHSISISSKRPKIIKLHGDYLFEDIKSTLRETESLEHNIKDKLIEFCKEYGLIVVGYSGSDRSIMDVLDLLLKNEAYLKNGIYWCVRKEDEISPILKNLFWKDRVYPVLIEGFDEFFCQIHQTLIPKVKLFNDYTESKQQKIIQQIINSKSNFEDINILRAIESLEIENEKQSFSFELTQKLTENEHDQNVSIKIHDTKKLLEIDRLMNQDMNLAYSKANSYYIQNESISVKVYLLQKLIDISQSLGKKEENLKWIDELINSDPYRFDYYKIKLRTMNTLEQKYQYCRTLEERFKHSTSFLNFIAELGIDLIDTIKNYQNDDSFLDKIMENIDKSLIMLPSLDNSAWKKKISLLKTKINLCYKSKNRQKVDEIEKEAKSIIERARNINAHSIEFLDLETYYVCLFKDKTYSSTLINDLYSLINLSNKDKKYNIFLLLDKIYNDENLEISLTDKIKFYRDYIGFDEQYPLEAIISKLKLMYLSKVDVAELSGHLHKVIMERNFFNNFDSIMELVTLIDVTLISKINSILDSKIHEIKPEYFNKFKSRIHLYNKEFDKAISYIDKQFTYQPIDESYYIHKSFILLKAEKYNEIIQLKNEYENSYFDFSSDIFLVNSEFASKKLNKDQYNKYKLDAIASKTNISLQVSLACSIIDDAKKTQGMSRLYKIIENNPLAYFNYNEWVFFEKEEVSILMEKAKIADELKLLI